MSRASTTVTKTLSDGLQAIMEAKVKKDTGRLGCLFSTRNNNYLYDTGTGKVLSVGDDIFFLLYKFFDENISADEFDSILSNLPSDQVALFVSTVKKESLLKRPILANYGDDLRNKLLDTKRTKQVVLEVTEKCNFRCKYCIYQEYNDIDREFGHRNMDFETARVALDMLLQSVEKKVFLTFYGGEPLLNFDLIRQCVEYAESNKGDKEIGYSVTTNLTLVTDAIANFIASYKDFSVVASLDGNALRHNKYRVYADGSHTHKDAIRGIKTLSDAFTPLKRQLNINAVLTPPYDKEALESVNTFFESMDFLPNTTQVWCTYPTLGTCKEVDPYFEKIRENRKYYLHSSCDPLGKWAFAKMLEKGLSADNTKNLYFKPCVDTLLAINDRAIFDYPSNMENCNANCMPGERKIYVTVDGDFKVCERVGLSPSIGNIETGLDKEAIEKYYIDGWCNEYYESCNACWAYNLCTLCYSGLVDEHGVKSSDFKNDCESCRVTSKARLEVYHQLMEENPGLLQILKDVVHA